MASCDEIFGLQLNFEHQSSFDSLFKPADTNRKAFMYFQNPKMSREKLQDWPSVLRNWLNTQSQNFAISCVSSFCSFINCFEAKFLVFRKTHIDYCKTDDQNDKIFKLNWRLHDWQTLSLIFRKKRRQMLKLNFAETLLPDTRKLKKNNDSWIWNFHVVQRKCFPRGSATSEEIFTWLFLLLERDLVDKISRAKFLESFHRQHTSWVTSPALQTFTYVQLERSKTSTYKWVMPHIKTWRCHWLRET